MAKRLGALAACLCAGTLLAAQPAAALEYEEVPAHVNAVPISAFYSKPSPVVGRTFSFTIMTGYCLGDPKPRIDHIRVVERPKTATWPHGAAIVTAYLLFPAEWHVVPPEHSEVIYNACAGLGLGISKRIKLDRPTEKMAFFDGSYDPPRRIRMSR